MYRKRLAAFAVGPKGPHTPGSPRCWGLVHLSGSLPSRNTHAKSARAPCDILHRGAAAPGLGKGREGGQHHLARRVAGSGPELRLLREVPSGSPARLLVRHHPLLQNATHAQARTCLTSPNADPILGERLVIGKRLFNAVPVVCPRGLWPIAGDGR